MAQKVSDKVHDQYRSRGGATCRRESVLKSFIFEHQNALQ